MRAVDNFPFFSDYERTNVRECFVLLKFLGAGRFAGALVPDKFHSRAFSACGEFVSDRARRRKSFAVFFRIVLPGFRLGADRRSGIRWPKNGTYHMTSPYANHTR